MNSLTLVKILSGHTLDVSAIEMLNSGYLMTGSSDTNYIVWNLADGSIVSSGVAANGKKVTRIVQTSTTKVIIGANDPSIFFYDMTNPASPIQTAISPSYLSSPCTSMVMVNLNTIWVASATPTVNAFMTDTTWQSDSRTFGSNDIESLEYLGS